jgi:hypothetical protein
MDVLGIFSALVANARVAHGGLTPRFAKWEGFMRSFGIISSIAVISFLAIISCAQDPAADPPMTGAQSQELSDSTLDDPPVTPSIADAETAAGAGPVDDAIVPHASCSTVLFCNAAGADGAQCKQTGCSLGAAENECKSEVKSVCGSPVVCPIRFFPSTGGSITLGCQPAVCAGNAIECGGHCCGTSATFCSGTHCCDGIHGGGGCPVP